MKEVIAVVGPGVGFGSSAVFGVEAYMVGAVYEVFGDGAKDN